MQKGKKKKKNQKGFCKSLHKCLNHAWWQRQSDIIKSRSSAAVWGALKIQMIALGNTPSLCRSWLAAARLLSVMLFDCIKLIVLEKREHNVYVKCADLSCSSRGEKQSFWELSLKVPAKWCPASVNISPSSQSKGNIEKLRAKTSSPKKRLRKLLSSEDSSYSTKAKPVRKWLSVFFVCVLP